MLSRRGLTLAELLVALVLAGVVLGTATASLLRQQRTHARILTVTDADAQSRAALLVLASQLSLLDPRAGDLSAGQAEDSAIQFRALIASSFACAAGAGAVTLLPEVADSLPLGGAVADPHPGDTLWWRVDSTWRAAELSGAGPVSTSCVAPVAASGTAHRVVVSTPDTIPAGTPIRITRQARFGIYRASDGTWQLGYREWNAPANRFASPQPVVGPLLPRSSSRRSRIRYFDRAGAELVAAPTAIDVRLIARIRIVASVLARTPAPGQDSVRTDSVDVPLAGGGPP